jgi:citrate synthase
VLSAASVPDCIDIGKLYKETGNFTYDPGFMSTASCRSAITYIDGDAGRADVRGYPDRAAGQEFQLPRSQLPADARRAAEQGSSSASSSTRSRITR